MRFVIHGDFWQLFPDTVVGVVLASALDNNQDDTNAIAALL